MNENSSRNFYVPTPTRRKGIKSFLYNNINHPLSASPYLVPEKQSKVGNENKPIIFNQQSQTRQHKIYGSFTTIT